MLPGKVEGLRFLMFQHQAEGGCELEHSGVSAFKLYKVFFPCFRLDDDRPVVNIGGLPYLIVEGLSSRLQGVTHRKASCILEAKHAPLYTPKVSMVMIVIYLWCHRYVIQYWDHVFYHMHVSDIHPSTLISLLPS